MQNNVNKKQNKKQNTGLKRKTTDKFYTIPSIVDLCIKLFKKNIDIQDNDLCIEPSAGNGAFINHIKSLFKYYKFYDLQPEHPLIVKQDYLTLNHNTVISNKYNKIHVIGNPPFGRQSSLAIKFIKKSISFCNTISFILPKSFKKDTLQKHFHKNFHLICEHDLPDNSFTIDNNLYNVPCVFQIWLKKNISRILPVKLLPNNYTFVKKQDDHDISFRRVGGKAGTIDTNTTDKSTQSHYFIKFNIPFTDEIFQRLSNINYTTKNYTCGPKSISKQELIKEFNSVI